MNLRLFIVLLSSFQLMSCKPKELKHDADDKILATVNNKKLYLSDVSSLLNAGMSNKDSLHVLKGLINNWVTDQLMINEAENNIPKDLNLDDLVENYRASLLLYQYETKLVEEYLDTLVTFDQKQAYYNDNKEEYILSEPVVKYLVAKVPLNAKKRDEFKSDWKESNLDKIEFFCKKFGNFYELDGKTWKTQTELLAVLPENLFTASNSSKSGDYIKSDKEYEYYVKILDFVGKNEIPPFEYIDSKITKVILNDRKEQLLKNKKQQLFDKVGHSSKVKFYLD